MMETAAGVSLMIMYEDDSVDVRYGNGSRLQLSPCGCEFLLVRAPDPSTHHPLQPSERVRQRTRFTISTHKELMVAALTFRNKYASRPYLPGELIPAEHKKPFFSTDSDVQWPEWSSSLPAEVGPGGETVVRSEEGRAALMLSPSGEEFSVEFTCSLSQTQNQHHGVQRLSRGPDGGPGSQQQQVSNLICRATDNETREVHQGRGSRRNKSVRSRSCSPRIFSTSQPQPEEMFQSTTVVQHRSSCSYAPMWSYPLSLARRRHAARLSKSKDVGAEGTDASVEADRKINRSERRSHVPQALPLTCPSPHRHRWKVKDPLAKKEQSELDLPTELVKVMWCQGVTYRILSGAVSAIEVSPGDGSVIRSNGVLNAYFTHHQPELQSGRVKEASYHLNCLPPDVLGQVYSICSVVSRASRILTCYDQAKQSLTLPATPSCLQEAKEGRHFSKPPLLEDNLYNPAAAEHHTNVTQTEEIQSSDLVAAELEKIKRFNFLLENSRLQIKATGCEEPQGRRAEEEEETHAPVSESCVSEALQRTSTAIQDIDALISAVTLT